MPTPDIITLGCRLNTFESGVMRTHAEAAGIERCVIVNTCAVTNEATSQAAQTVRRLSREQPDARIVVTGCAAQIDPQRFAAIEGVDHVVGNAEKIEATTWSEIAAGTAPRVMAGNIMAARHVASRAIDGIATRARAVVQVQNGCDHRCTFCIIPFGRGRARSVPATEVVATIRRLADRGSSEIILTGVDLTSYGADLDGQPTLGRLVRQILAEVPELERLRLSSIDQVEADGDLRSAIAEEPRLMPHFHLSLQSGDDMILKRMKRRHLRADAIRFCAEVRKRRPDVVFGADLIAGFPTETEEMFENSLRLVEECGITFLHVFPFSPRPGTPAARMPQVPRDNIKERAARLRAAGEAALARYLALLPGSDVEILLERGGIGRTPQHAEVKFADATPDHLFGRIVRARVARHDGRRLYGEIAA